MRSSPLIQVRLGVAGGLYKPTSTRKKVNSARHELWAKDRRFIRNSKALADLPASGSEESGVFDPTAHTPLKETHALWRDVSPLVKITSCARAIAERQSPWAWSLRVAPSFIENEQNPLDYVYRRLARNLRKELRRDCDFFAVVHISSPTGDEFHLHGVIDLLPSELHAARAAMKAAGGLWRRKSPASGNQVKFEALTDADGWADYCLRERSKAARWLKEHRARINPLAKGSPQTEAITQPLRSAGKELYEHDRQALKPTPVKSPSPRRATFEETGYLSDEQMEWLARAIARDEFSV